MSFDREKLLRKLTFELAMNPNMTMTELAKRAKISRASLNRIYSSKNFLKETILERVKEIYREISELLNKNHEDFIKNLRDVIAIFQANRNYILFICRDVFAESVDEKIFRQQEAELTKFFSVGQEQNLIDKKFSAETVANVFLGNITWFLCMHAEKNNVDENELKKIIFETFWNGIGNKTAYDSAQN
ncbi:MAG: TetR/AcrR family transcriptional regulator [Selenomonadaceae bacterium]|nr:TetR/AcrR family transcriptional regulator [Selenomonadaceae bacterium]